MITLFIDNKKFNIQKKQNLLHTCLSLGFDIPYFCWHPELGSIGACRQCAVKQYKNIDDKTGHIIMSCMTPIFDGIRISINDLEAKQFRTKVIECLMINHPHDCPVCEEAGHCHLQDMTVMTKHTKRNYRFTKRTHYNQNLGPFITHEMNRCITCYRCIRYYKDYADGTDFGVFGIHDNIYFGRTKDGALENEFSGNLVEICPTGVFTDKVHSKHYTRKWDMQYAPSICMQCSLGCNIISGERYGEVRKIENRYNGMVNHYFLCDRGRFGYGYVNRLDRPQQPQIMIKKKIHKISDIEAIKHLANIIIKNNKNIIGIGSPRASIESNYALQKLVGIENFYSGISSNEQKQLNLIVKILQNSGIYTPSMREIENYDAIIILGEDVTQTGARIALSIRQAIKQKNKIIAQKENINDWNTLAISNIGQNNKHPLFIINIDNTRLDDIALLTHHAPLNDQARLGFAIANYIDHDAPSVINLHNNLKNIAKFIAKTLLKSKKPLIISGTHSGNINIIEAAANIAYALKKQKIDVGISYIVPEVNSIGLTLMNSKPLDIALQNIINKKVNIAIVMENDLYRHNNIDTINIALKTIKTLIVVDHQYTTLANKANILLPAASFAEGSGTVINNEGRMQRYFKVFNPRYYKPKNLIKDSWRWLYCLNSKIKHNKINWTKLDSIIQECSMSMPQFNSIVDVAPNASFRIKGQKISRSPHCYSGRTSQTSKIQIHEPGQPNDIDSYFSFSMEGINHYNTQQQHIPYVWHPGWNSVQAWNKFQNNIGKNLRFNDPGIRLFNNTNILDFKYFSNIPNNWISKDNQWTIVAYYHLFGSDETSQKSEVIQQHMIEPYIMISIDDMKKLNLQIGDKAEFQYSQKKYILPVKMSKHLFSGNIGLPIGLPNISPSMIGNIITNLHKKE